MNNKLPIDCENYSCTTFDYSEGKKYAKTICFPLSHNVFINGDIYQDGITLTESENGLIATYHHKDSKGSPEYMRFCPFCGGKLKNF